MISGMAPMKTFQKRRVMNTYGKPCLLCGEQTLHEVQDVPVCLSCEAEAIEEIRESSCCAWCGKLTSELVNGYCPVCEDASHLASYGIYGPIPKRAIP